MNLSLQATLLQQGFLGTQASFYADLILVLEIAMGLALVVGAFLARKRRYRAHAACQCFIVLLNLLIVLLVMLPSFRVRVTPKIPARLGSPFYSLATAHAALGSITEITGIYILLAAGTNLLPRSLSMVRYKLWMRTVLALWWVVLLLGLATYARWYIR